MHTRGTGLRNVGRRALAIALSFGQSGIAAAAADTVTLRIPIERDTAIMTPHKQNNDGSWPYGWIRKTTRELLGFDLSPLQGRAADVVSATIRLVVAQNHFDAHGTALDLHPFDARFGDWQEGSDRFNRFNYCDVWSAPARRHATQGATWLCAVDTNSRSAAARCRAGTDWAPIPQQRVHRGFAAGIEPQLARGENSAFERHDVCQRPVLDHSTCAPSCVASLECFRSGGRVEDCWRTMEIAVTSDVRRMLEDDGATLHASWMLKRRVEQGAGGFHFFSREAVCVLGGGDPQSPYRALQPVLEVVLAQQPGTDPPEVVDPPLHCEAFAD